VFNFLSDILTLNITAQTFRIKKTENNWEDLLNLKRKRKTN